MNKSCLGGHLSKNDVATEAGSGQKYGTMVTAEEVAAFCDERTGRIGFPDLPEAHNGLQVGKRGPVHRVGAAVDAGLGPFRLAAREKIDFLLVHHGLGWDRPWPLTGRHLEKVRLLLDNNCALYSCHLPLDAHPVIGNNVLLARTLGLEPAGDFLPFEGRAIGLLAACPFERAELEVRLRACYPATVGLTFGSTRPAQVAVVTGSGVAAVGRLADAGVDTLITGELKQHHFNLAQELSLNLFCCGHYATEISGVRALASEVSTHFGIPWSFLDTGCPL